MARIMRAIMPTQATAKMMDPALMVPVATSARTMTIIGMQQAIIIQ
jgi:hypothetical protein